MKNILTVLSVALVLSSCGEDSGPTNYLEIIGGGLTFNYRYSQATMVVIGKQRTPLPDGSKVEALFDIPGEAVREQVSRPAMTGKLTYKLESKYLTGIRKGIPLNVTLRLLDASGKELDRDETQYVSDIDQLTLPSRPLVDPSKPNYVPLLDNL